MCELLFFSGLCFSCSFSKAELVVRVMLLIFWNKKNIYRIDGFFSRSASRFFFLFVRSMVKHVCVRMNSFHCVVVSSLLLFYTFFRPLAVTSSSPNYIHDGVHLTASTAIVTAAAAAAAAPIASCVCVFMDMLNN